MCNCGTGRQSFASAGSQTIHRHQQRTGSDVMIEYTGKSALTVQGFVTGRKYRFPMPGATIMADYRDAARMLSLPQLIIKK